MAGPEDMILPPLREMRAEIAGFRDESRHGFELMDQRFRKLEETQTSSRPALTADSLLSKLVTGEFEERIEALEKKVRDLEAHK